MPAAWPSGLQSLLNEASFSFEIGSTVLRSENQMGPAKVRRLMTKSVDVVTGTIDLHRDDFNDFYFFFDTTLNGGVTTFYYDHPITAAETEFRWVGVPAIAPLGGEYFRVSFKWEILP